MTNGIGKRLRTLLSRPYPLWRGGWAETRFAIAATALATAIVYAARPFGLAAVPDPAGAALILQLGAACLATTLVLRVVLPWLLQRRWDESRWTAGRQVAWEVVEVVAIAGALMTVLAWNGHIDVSATRARGFVAITALCAIVPVLIRILLTERWLRRRHERRAAALSDAPPSTPPHAACLVRARDGAIELDADALRYVRAEANYVDVVFLRDGERSHRLLRVALSDVERQFAPDVVVRCHRSYLVAIGAIARVRGNAQGFRLELRDLPETVPVARARAKAVLALLERRYDAPTQQPDEELPANESP